MNNYLERSIKFFIVSDQEIKLSMSSTESDIRCSLHFTANNSMMFLFTNISYVITHDAIYKKVSNFRIKDFDLTMKSGFQLLEMKLYVFAALIY